MSDDTANGETRAEFSAIIPAGGSGTRLWPLSQPDRPKFLIDLTGTGTSLLQDTVARLKPIAARLIVATGVKHRAAVLSQVPELGDAGIVAEPDPRDSMAAIALSTAILEKRHGPHVVGSFAADHVIRRPDEFREAVSTAIVTAERGDVVTLGIEPRGPSTAFGYIRAGEHLADVPGVRRVAAFTEKPDAPTAAAMISSGSHYWNAGMFVFRTDVLLGHLARLMPAMEAGVREIAEAWDGSKRDEVLGRVWPGLQRIAIDHAIAEPVAAQGGVAVVPVDIDWHDIGDFAVLAELTAPDGEGTRAIGRTSPVVAVDSRAPMVIGGKRPVAIVGLDEVTVVDTDEALLVLRRACSQRVKEASEGMAAR